MHQWLMILLAAFMATCSILMLLIDIQVQKVKGEVFSVHKDMLQVLSRIERKLTDDDEKIKEMLEDLKDLENTGKE